MLGQVSSGWVRLDQVDRLGQVMSV